MCLNVFASFQQVVSSSPHEIHGAGESVLDEMVAPGLIDNPLYVCFNIDFRKAVVNYIAGEQVDAPG